MLSANKHDVANAVAGLFDSFAPIPKNRFGAHILEMRSFKGGYINKKSDDNSTKDFTLHNRKRIIHVSDSDTNDKACRPILNLGSRLNLPEPCVRHFFFLAESIPIPKLLES